MVYMKRLAAAAVLTCATLLTGCGNFFVCQKASCPTTTTTTNSGDYLYISNTASGPDDIAGYEIASGALTAISGSTYDLGFSPVAMTVAPANGFLYVASDAGANPAGVYLFAIGSTGALTQANNGNPIVTDSTISTMTISPDGNYLFTLGTSLLGEVVLSQYSLNTSTGIPTGNPTTFSTNATSCALNVTGTPIIQQCSVTVSPSKAYLAVALGQAGVLIFPYSSSGGALNYTQAVAALSSTSGDYSLAFDTNNNLYVASTFALTPYTGIGGTAAPVAGIGQSYAAGATPRSVTLNSTGAYVYTANIGLSTISAYTTSSAGVLTGVGAPVAGPATVSALGVDNSGKYLVAAGYNATNGIQLFNITSTGALTTAGSTAGTDADTSSPIVIALTH